MKTASIRFFALLIFAASIALSAPAADRKLTFTPADTHIEWVLDATGHDVEGGFDLISGTIVWDSATGNAEGLIEIDATSARTGNSRRDKTMHEDVLESATYPKFVFKPTHVDGTLADTGSSRIQLQGVLTIHGDDHALTLASEATRVGDELKIKSEFAIPFVEWGMKDPSFLFLRVDKKVQVTLSASAIVTSMKTEASAGER